MALSHQSKGATSPIKNPQEYQKDKMLVNQTQLSAIAVTAPILVIRGICNIVMDRFPLTHIAPHMAMETMK